MKIRPTLSALALVLAAFPIAALADISGTVTLAANTALSLDTGTTSASGGDILWSGTAMTPQTSATVDNISAVTGFSGASTFSALTQSTLSVFGAAYTKSPLTASALPVGDIFAVHTNAGYYAAVLVTAVSGTSISLQYVTFGVNSGPNITLVENNYGEIPPGFSNSGIAPGALFFIVGTGLATPGTVAVLQNSVGATLPATLNGSSVQVTVGGKTVTPAFYYAQPTALGLVMPSGTPTGSAQVTVTVGGQTSAAYTIQVVANAMGFDAYYGTGNGLGVATNAATGALYNYSNAIPPGTTVVLWGSGLGADPKPSRDTTYLGVTSIAADSINALTHIYVGGVDGGAPGYQGASGYPGLNQVNFTIPTSAPTGCNVSLVGVNAAGVPTNSITLPIGTGGCVDPASNISGSQLAGASALTTVNAGALAIGQSTAPAASGGTTVTQYAVANFQSLTGAATGANASQVSIGGCIVKQNPPAATSTASIGLDAGAITVAGPTGSALPLTAIAGIPGESYVQLASGSIPAGGGTFTFKASGGANIGPFSATLSFPGSQFVWTNQSAAATVTRASGLTVIWNWTPNSVGSYAHISGISTSTATGNASASFSCNASLFAGQFTVPGYILAALPAGTGTVTVEIDAENGAGIAASGLNYGTTLAFIGIQVNATFN